MKVAEEFKVQDKHRIFISHMVQMKDYYLWQKERDSYALYPTWFRWKMRYANEVPHDDDLYIPHGSDESWKTNHMKSPLIYFISHMVQMKARFSEHLSLL